MIVTISIEVSLSSGRFLSNMNLDLSTVPLSQKTPLWLPCRGRSSGRKELSVWEVACRDYQPKRSPSLRLWVNLKQTLTPSSHTSGRGACLRVPVLGPRPLCLGAAQSLRIIQKPCSPTTFGGSHTWQLPLIFNPLCSFLYRLFQTSCMRLTPSQLFPLCMTTTFFSLHLGPHAPEPNLDPLTCIQ